MHDEETYSREATCLILIKNINDPPIVHNFNVTGNENEIIYFKALQFQSNFYDVDKDELN